MQTVLIELEDKLKDLLSFVYSTDSEIEEVNAKNKDNKERIA